MSNYNNYIGEHMSEPLRVLEPTNLTTELTYKNIGFIAESGDYVPLIKSISDLTDEELLFVYKGSNLIHEEFLHVVSSCGSVRWYCNGSDDMIMELDIKTGTWDINTEGMYSIDMQQILNRLYSLHVSLDYDELIRTGKAVRKV